MLKSVTKIGEESGIKDMIHEAASKAVESKAVAAAVAGGTAALSLSNVQSIASLVATVTAVMLTVILMVKHLYETWLMYKKAKKEDEEA